MPATLTSWLAGAREPKAALWIAVVYALVAAVWIFASDEVLRILVSDPQTVARLQTAKGWLFILVTAALLYALLRRRAETLRHREAVLASVMAAAPVPVIVLDTRGRVVIWNAASARVLGWSEQEAVGHPLPERGHEAVETWFPGVLGGDSLTDVELTWHHRDGRTIEVLASAAPLRDADGRITHVVVLLVDVTERKQLELQLRQAQKMEALGQFTAGIAHDFRNILTVILGSAEILRDTVRERIPETLPDLDELQKAADRGTDITRKLLAFSRMEQLAMRPVDLREVVRDAGGVLRRLLPETIALDVAVASQSLVSNVDPNSLVHILANLATNARDAMPDGGELRVRAERMGSPPGHRTPPGGDTPAGEYVGITVTDTGHGMDPETGARVFDPFFTTKPSGSGTGLGLAMVHGLVTEQRGFIDLESEPGRGTTVRVCFPRLGTPAKTVPAPEETGDLRGGSETILIAEDEEALRRMSRRILERLGYRVLVAENGEEALRLFREHAGEIDLVISDSVMPKLSGVALYESISALSPGTPFLLASGYTPEDARRGLAPRADIPFLPKPWTLQELARKVREVLDAARGSP